MNLFTKSEGYGVFNTSLDSKPEIKSGIQFLTYASSQWVIFNKILRVMKLTFILLVVLILNASAEGFSQKVTYSGENVSLETVFTVIKKQTGYGFFFQEELFALAKPVTINASNEDLSKVLASVFKDQPLDFSIKNKTILVSKKTFPTNALKQIQNLSAVSEEIDLQKDIVVKGVVTDSKGETLPGVSVKLKGTAIGASTDLDGKFSISIPDGNGTLVFSFIGFTSQEVAVNQRTSIIVKLETANTALNEVVVTALGIKRQSKSLGYATTNVSAEELTVNRTTNFMNALQGKVAGVNITPMGTGPAGTSKIRIRGQSSFGGNNSPLIVVNGVPIDNTIYAARGDVSERGSNRTSDGGDGLGSINPDDIESMTVLKGAAASALYGSRAKDGVIMITTKNKGSDGVTLSYNSNYTTDQPLDYTDYQSEYGQGENGVRPTTAFPTSGVWSFGERFQPGMTHTLFNNITVPYEYQGSVIDKYYRTGNNMTNTISLASGGANGGMNISVSNLKSNAILPNSGYDRNTINLGFTQNLGKKLTVTGNVNYSKENRKNPPNIAEQDFSPVTIFTLATSMPLSILEQYAEDANGNENVWSRFTNRTNPYFALKRFDNIQNDRVFGNITAKYNLTDWLFVQGRIGQDYYAREQDYNLPTGTQRQPAAPAGFVNGQFVQDARSVRELNADFLIGANKTFGDFGASLNAGGNTMNRKISRHNVFVQDFYTRGLYTIGNSRQRDAIYDYSEREVNSFYGSAELSYKDFLFLNGTVRNDWFSTLSPANRSILYPSVTGSFVFSQAFGSALPKWLNFGKIRAAYAEVGSDTDISPYANNLFYGIGAQQFPSPSGAAQPLGNINGSTVPNADLRPMRVSEKEFGLELKVLDNLIGLDFTYYNKLSSDQILRAQTSNAGGYLNQLINVGKSRNQGVEMLVTVNPIRTQNVYWNLAFNTSYNKTEVLDLGSGVSDNMITVGTADFTGELRQVVGQPMGQLYGFGYLRDAQGRQVFDVGNGRPLRTPTQIAFGSAIPVWIGGISNSISVKGVEMSFLVDYKLGHKLISGTNHNAWRHGLHKATLVGRAENLVLGNGVNQNGQVNATKSGLQAYYETVRSQNIAEQFVYNAGLWQLRQITLGYDFTRFIPARLSFIKGLRLNGVANNVWAIKKWVDNIHPEQSGLPSDNLVGLEATGLPITRSIGFNLNVKF